MTIYMPQLLFRYRVRDNIGKMLTGSCDAAACHGPNGCGAAICVVAPTTRQLTELPGQQLDGNTARRVPIAGARG